MSQYRYRTRKPCTVPVAACSYDCANRAIAANSYKQTLLKSEYHASDPLRAWRPQKMADSRVYMRHL